MAVETKQGQGNLAAVTLAAFATVLIIAFFSYRSGDIGQLTQLVGDLRGGPIVGNAMVESLYGIASAILILLSWFGLGSIVDGVIVSATDDDGSEAMYFVRSTAIGAAGWSIAWFFLGVAGFYNSTTAVASIVLGILLALFGVFHNVEIPRGWPRRPSAITLSLSTLITIPVLLALIASVAPPIAKDTLLYHFAVSNGFVAQGSNGVIEGNIASYLALGTEMHTVWAMLLGGIVGERAGEAAAGATAWIFLPLLLMAVFGWARELIKSRSWSLIAVLMVATIPTVYYVASSGYVDLSLALYLTLATYALTRWWKQPSWGWGLLVSIFLGAALSVKLTAVFAFAAFVLVILLRARDGNSQAGSLRSGRIVATGFAALLLAGVIASPSYIRTWAATGSPVFPFYMSIWKGEAANWDVERSNLFQAMNSQYGGVDTDKVNYLTAPVRVSIAAQPEQPRYYDGVLGVAFLIGLPLLIWALWKLDLAVEIKIAAAVAGLTYLFWLFSSEQLRYLLPVVPLAAIAIAAAAEKIGGSVKSVAQYALAAASACAALTSFAWFCQKAPFRVVLGGETRDAYLARHLDYYPYYQWINAETPPEAKVWLINMRRDTYNIERPVFSDYLFEDWTLRKMVWESGNAQELRAKAAAMNVEHVLARHDFLFDYQRSTLVDDKKPRAENEAKLKMAREFLLDPQRTVMSDAKFSLVRVN